MRHLALVTLLSAAAAPAQIWSPPQTMPNMPRSPIRFEPNRAPPRIERDLGDVRQRIRDGRDDGQLSRSDARQLRRGADRIAASADRYRSDGLSQSEARELETRARVLRDQVDLTRGRR